jgi:altronate dehydratase
MSSGPVIDIAEVAVRPEPGDNAAIVARDLDPGTRLRIDAAVVELPHRVLEGHRVVVEQVSEGGDLLSWSTPFARARRDLRPGDCICTPSSLAALRDRGVTGLPGQPTAENVSLEPYELDEAALHLGEQIEPAPEPRTFLGYARARGAAGTRNHVVVIGATSRSSAFVTELARRLAAVQPGGFDGVVPVAHTEAGEDERPNNIDYVLATLAGFMLNPNVGAVLLVDEVGDVVTGAEVAAFMRDRGYPEIAVPHAYFTRRGGFEDDLSAAAALVEQWIPEVAAQERTEQPLADVRIGMQCGGSDAFSGISANPLSGALSAEVVRHGGTAVLSETDELIGAEGYVLENVRSVEVARAFLDKMAVFKERVSWHGATAEGNPSGGNVFRGLYNIVLKSVGAARKRDRRMRLDDVLDYAQPLRRNGFVFMDSPGNDLESVAGQVAAGCNLITFTTGNGSITNFPFVPTIKLVTTTKRYDLLHHEMDIDSGRYLTGTPMAELAAEAFEQTIAAVSGTPTAGEQAGHSQVSIWRDWRQTRPTGPVPLRLEFTPEDQDIETEGEPLVGVRRTPPAELPTTVSMYELDGRRSPEQLALVLPTSLCSGQVALRLADQAAEGDWTRGRTTRTVALPHTEGCGVSSGPAENTYARMMTSYLAHPNVALALLLEHGCEKTHNDYFRSRLVEGGLDPSRFGWASIQLDGGIEATTARVRDWFETTSLTMASPARVDAGLGDLTIALDARGPLSVETARALAEVGGWVVGRGGSVLLASTGALLAEPAFREHAFGSPDSVPVTLAHGQRATRPGWHVMRMPGTDWTEAGSGLGAGGAQLLLVHVAGGSVSGQRLLPVVQLSSDPDTATRLAADLDGTVTGDHHDQAIGFGRALVDVAAGHHVPRVLETGDVGFQVTRGRLGTSM